MLRGASKFISRSYSDTELTRRRVLVVQGFPLDANGRRALGISDTYY